MDAIQEVKDLPTAEARNFLGQFLFSGDDVFRAIGTLSGGQRSRVALARLTLQGANFLLLDEPTNHLDLPSQEILEEVLGRFPGTILLVSHDRYLAEALATDIWRVAGAELQAYEGNYSEYLRQAAAARGAAAGAAAAAAAEAAVPKAVITEQDRERAKEERRQRRAAEKRAEQAAALEAEIASLEARLNQLSSQLESASLAGNVQRVHELGLTYQATEAELQRVMGQWVLLEG